VLGGLIQGIRVENGQFAGGTFDWLTPFSVFCGLALVAGYALLGAGWLIWKTEGATQVFAREVGHAALLLVALMMVVVSAWSALTEPAVASRWFAWPNLALLAPVPLVTALVIVAIWRSLWGPRDVLTFQLSMILFALGFGGLCISLWPYIVPRQITIWDGIADPQTLWFVGVGIVIVMPIVLAYQARAYWVFRGKTRIHEDDSGYGERPAIQSRRTSAQNNSLHIS
jgi:cytochrome d ubiquinol oxidase subunit II